MIPPGIRFAPVDGKTLQQISYPDGTVQFVWRRAGGMTQLVQRSDSAVAQKHWLDLIFLIGPGEVRSMHWKAGRLYRNGKLVGLNLVGLPPAELTKRLAGPHPQLRLIRANAVTPALLKGLASTARTDLILDLMEYRGTPAALEGLKPLAPRIWGIRLGPGKRRSPKYTERSIYALRHPVRLELLQLVGPCLASVAAHLGRFKRLRFLILGGSAASAKGAGSLSTLFKKLPNLETVWLSEPSFSELHCGPRIDIAFVPGLQSAGRLEKGRSAVAHVTRAACARPPIALRHLSPTGRLAWT